MRHEATEDVQQLAASTRGVMRCRKSGLKKASYVNDISGHDSRINDALLKRGQIFQDHSVRVLRHLRNRHRL
jgi:hypothetical protein